VRDRIAQGDFLNQQKTSLNKNYGEIEQNKPCALPHPIVSKRNLCSEDIFGTQADTKRIGVFTHY
jgi:hypothetical protein